MHVRKLDTGARPRWAWRLSSHCSFLDWVQVHYSRLYDELWRSFRDGVLFDLVGGSIDFNPEVSRLLAANLLGRGHISLFGDK